MRQWAWIACVHSTFLQIDGHIFNLQRMTFSCCGWPKQASERSSYQVAKPYGCIITLVGEGRVETEDSAETPRETPQTVCTEPRACL